ncbi:Ger(x)C family spore germination protein [Paenibacillus apiarius]|uniref:Ger(X)C family spore germination protein n=1 Tax=Paenibacillus apiarius TaxID=46240 RepID=A0ABT4DQ50_9BACL|nr:Ger(x)C family spore germination protein [Paenibacillus apiarius]MCY9513932.1 Ger(x)C family spore germination protein [Paenibacillus apiarius]MCY9519449.1 Ger(x)C family spore germination protein [Paenibacillus apiarius]MCY9552324.1 Ger(x)C family spore germination protein [Paenibacillus apiarius]MCY9556204.1 Ger(x)C family spore germination protein [Paenibacillus apiarius]MCY9681739.1 Ger(x)C family spore germination protein [Paenibacillus apiarius]
MKRKAALLMCVLLIFIAGCWSRRELNDLAIAVGFGIDRSGEQYEVSVQVVNPGEVAAKQPGGQRAPVTMYHAKGNTVFEAIRRMTTVTPRKVYFSQLRMFIIGDALAREGIREALDFLSRDHELRTDFYIAVARELTAKEIMSFYTPLEKIPASKMHNSLDVSEKSWAPTVAIKLDELITDLVSDGKEAVLTGITILGEREEGTKRENVLMIDPPAFLKYLGIGVFQEDKLVGWLNEKESKGYSIITDMLDSTIISSPCPEGGRVGIEVIKSKTKMKGKARNGKPEVELEIRTEANIGDVECKLDLTKERTIVRLEQEFEKIMQQNAEQAIKKAKSLEADIFGFGEAIRRDNPRYWSTVKNDWRSRFVDLPVRIKADVKIRHTGTVASPFFNQLKE